jgi:xanthine dehydrogenase accessory factor
MRSVGSLMAVCCDGSFVGYISNGCVDADIISQSKISISENKTRIIQYGKGLNIKILNFHAVVL